MAVDDDADVIFTLKKELEQSGFSLDVFNDLTYPSDKSDRKIFDETTQFVSTVIVLAIDNAPLRTIRRFSSVATREEAT